VHAVDVSEEAIARNAAKLPGVRFEAGDFLDLELPPAAYDVALSITVVQHIPFARQEDAVARLATLLRPGGLAVLLESLRVGPLTYGRPLDDWLALFARHGLRPQQVRGYAFALPLRAVQSLVSRSRGGTGSTTEQPEATQRSRARALYWALGVRPAVTLSALTEGAARRLLPASAATHAAFVLVRDA
jgi:SAM-dependent methyltransferase